MDNFTKRGKNTTKGILSKGKEGRTEKRKWKVGRRAFQKFKGKNKVACEKKGTVGWSTLQTQPEARANHRSKIPEEEREWPKLVLQKHSEPKGTGGIRKRG